MYLFLCIFSLWGWCLTDVLFIMPIIPVLIIYLLLCWDDLLILVCLLPILVISNWDIWIIKLRSCWIKERQWGVWPERNLSRIYLLSNMHLCILIVLLKLHCLWSMIAGNRSLSILCLIIINLVLEGLVILFFWIGLAIFCNLEKLRKKRGGLLLESILPSNQP